MTAKCILNVAATVQQRPWGSPGLAGPRQLYGSSKVQYRQVQPSIGCNRLLVLCPVPGTLAGRESLGKRGCPAIFHHSLAHSILVLSWNLMACTSPPLSFQLPAFRKDHHFWHGKQLLHTWGHCSVSLLRPTGSGSTHQA